MTAEEVGYYIRILCHMADKGRLTLKHMQSICKAYDTAYDLHNHFKIDENGLYYNQRLEDELIKRRNYTESRRDNAKHMHKHMPQHMGNGNRNGNKDIINNKDGIVKGNQFDFDALWAIYPNKLGKKQALLHFKASVKNEKNYEDIKKALNNYIESIRGTEARFIKHGSSWFNNWQDWVNYEKPKTEADIATLKEKFKL
jgi:tRNA U55 pseudouridine synthase TruB